MRKVLLLFAVLWSVTVSAQSPEGLSVRFGVNTAYPKWSHADQLISEYGELRPWLTVKPEMTDLMGGWNIGYAVSGDHFWAVMEFMSNRNSMRYKGVDSSGVEHKGTFVLIDRSLSLSAGFKFIDTPVFRLGLFGGLSFHPMVVKVAENKEYGQRFFAYLIMPFNAIGATPNPIDTKMFLAGQVGASLQIGGRHGLTVEPYYMLPFWKTSFKSTRDELNPNTPSQYTDDAFKGSMQHWGMRFIIYIGVTG